MEKKKLVTIFRGPKSAPGTKDAVTEPRSRHELSRASLRFLRVATREEVEGRGKDEGEESERENEKRRREGVVQRRGKEQ